MQPLEFVVFFIKKMHDGISVLIIPWNSGIVLAAYDLFTQCI